MKELIGQSSSVDNTPANRLTNISPVDNDTTEKHYREVDTVLQYIPRGKNISTCLEQIAFVQKLTVRIQILDPSLSGVDESAIRKLNGNPDIKRLMTAADEERIVATLRKHAFIETSINDGDQEVCSRYFVRSFPEKP